MSKIEKGDRVKCHFVWRHRTSSVGVFYTIMEGTCTGKIIKLDDYVYNRWGDYTKQIKVEDAFTELETALQAFREGMLYRAGEMDKEAAEYRALATAVPVEQKRV